MSKRNFYEILNSTTTASFEELRRNYKQLILQCHPDKLPHGNTDATNVTNDPTSATTATVDPYVNRPIVTSSTDELSADFVSINEAWNTLKDPTKRRLYDAELLLTKFQAHSNIYARLKLTDMKHCAATTTISSKTDSGSDSDVGGEGEGEGNSHGYYTYDCRCGGQYIVDESADSEILNRNRKQTQATAPPHSASNSEDLIDVQEQSTQQKQINDNDNNDDKNGQAAVGSSKAYVTPTNCSGNNSNSEMAFMDESIVNSGIPAIGADEDEEEEEVLVECSECSLVIVLT